MEEPLGGARGGSPMESEVGGFWKQAGPGSSVLQELQGNDRFSDCFLEDAESLRDLVSSSPSEHRLSRSQL